MVRADRCRWLRPWRLRRRWTSCGGRSVGIWFQTGTWGWGPGRDPEALRLRRSPLQGRKKSHACTPTLDWLTHLRLTLPHAGRGGGGDRQRDTDCTAPTVLPAATAPAAAAAERERERRLTLSHCRSHISAVLSPWQHIQG